MRHIPLAFVVVAAIACNRNPASPPAIPGVQMPAAPVIPGMPTAAQPGTAPSMPFGIPNIPGMPAIPGLPGAQPQAAAAPVVNWRLLMPFAPDTLGGHPAAAAAEGSSEGGMGIQVSEVHRNYTNGPKQIHLSITDTSMNPTLRMAFSIGQTVTVDSTDRQAHGVTIAGNPGMFEWRQNGGPLSKVSVLVGGRYIVMIEDNGAAAPDEAIGLANQLNIAGLAAVH